MIVTLIVLLTGRQPYYPYTPWIKKMKQEGGMPIRSISGGNMVESKGGYEVH